MKLYMKQKVFSFRDKFYIKDENGEDKYYIEGELISLGKKLHIYDMAGNELAFVHEKILSFLPRFFVYSNGVQVAEIVKKLSLLRPKYVIQGLGWDIEGSYWAHDYSITQNGRQIVTIHKAWMSWGDTFELDIQSSDNEVIALAVVLAIDCVMDARSNSAQ